MSNSDPRGKFVWHELLSADTAGAVAFYPKVVSWKAQPWERDSAYTLWVSKSGPVGAVLDMPGGATGAPHWLAYVAVADVAETVSKARSLGGTVLKDATEIPEVGTYAVLADPQGAEFAVYKSAGEHDHASSGSGDFSWHELATSDAEAAMRFYTQLLNWQVGPKHDMGPAGAYHLFLHGGNQYGGIYKAMHGEAPGWLCYVKVDDVDKAASAVKAAGGRVINGPMEVPGGSWVAQVLDPDGAAFAVHEEKPVKASAPAPAAKSAASQTATPATAPRAVQSPAAPAPTKAKQAAGSSAKPARAKRRPSAAASSPAARKPGAKVKSKAKAKTRAKAKVRGRPKAKAKTTAKTRAKTRARTAAGKTARRTAGRRKTAVRRAPARKKSSSASRSAARKRTVRRASPKKHR